MKKLITYQFSRLIECLFKPGLVIFMLCAFTTVKAQSIKVTGVVSATDGDLLPGVSILETGTTNGTVTGIAGQFVLNVHTGASITVKAIGYEIQNIIITNSKPLNINLVANVKTLNDVVVVGYGSKNKSTFAGSAVTLSAEDLNKSSLSVANLLTAKAAGVQVTQNNGTPGAALTIRIRGTNSINASSDPLYVIDGFPTNDGVGVTISPEDIASISILKDAASAAIYGSRGANGVIIITTKSGKNKKGNLTVDSYDGYQKVIKLYDLADGYENATRLNALDIASGTTTPYSAGRLDSLKQGLLGTNWQNVLFQLGKVEDNTLSFTGGSPNTSVYSSLDFLNQEGVVIDSRYQRVGARVNLDQKVGDKFSMSARVFGTYGIQNDLPLAPSTINGFLKQALKANPASTFDVNENIRGDETNPLYFLAATNRENDNYRTNGYFSLKYEPIKNLIIQSDQGIDINTSKVLYFAPSTVPAGVSGNGLATVTNIDETELIINPTATYSYKLKENNFKLLAGYNQQTYVYNEYDLTATNFSSNELGYDNLGTAQQFSAASGKSRIKRQSWFSRLDYDFNNRYIFTGTYRIDGSSVFGANNKLGYFPSGAFAWRFDQEDFSKNITFLSSGKARVSYGITGNDRINSGLTAVNFAADNSSKYTLDGVDQVSGIAITNLANPNLKWEQTASLDIGLDIGFLKDRIILETDYYDKQTTNLLLNSNIAPSTGFQTQFGNDGSVENKGFEFNIQTVNIDGKFKWSSSLNFSYNKNKVLSLGTNNADIYLGSLKPDGAADFENPFILRVGQPIDSFYGYEYAGIVQENDPVLKTTQKNSSPGEPKFVDVNHDGIIDANDRVVLGSGIPDAFYGFTNTFNYKHFQLDIVTQAQTGGKLLNLQKEDLEYPLSQGNTLNTVPSQVWSPTNTSGTLPATGFYGNPYGGWVNSKYIESSDYIRIKNINLAYNFPATTLKSIGISALSVYANVQNLVTFTKYSGLDPDVGNLVDNSQINQNGGRGIDFNAFPVNRMYVLGAKVTF
ncbi:SusC/RagA family TonB-linked outer membrane protein [Mucilaginibacter sp.]